VASDAVEVGMMYITGHDRSQLLLLPEAVDDYVGPDNPVQSWAVQLAQEAQRRKPRKSLYRFSLDMGLIGVISTQLWHHIYCGGGLAELPTWTPPDLNKTRLYQGTEVLNGATTEATVACSPS